MRTAMTLKVSKNELATFSEGDSTVKFRDGSGYLAEMAMYHELHCVVSAAYALEFSVS
jgi:hypothetical protein